MTNKDAVLKAVRQWWIVDGREGERLFDDEHEAIIYAGHLAEYDPTFNIHVVEASALERVLDANAALVVALAFIKSRLPILNGTKLGAQIESREELKEYADMLLREAENALSLNDTTMKEIAGEG